MPDYYESTLNVKVAFSFVLGQKIYSDHENRFIRPKKCHLKITLYLEKIEKNVLI